MIKKLNTIIILITLFCLILFIIACTAGKSEKKTVIRYIRWVSVQEAKDFQILIDKFMELHPSIKVIPEFLPWAAYWEKLRTSILNGDAADVISLSNIESAHYITRGVFLKMNSLEGVQTLLDEMHDSARKAVTYNDNIYAMPVGMAVRALIYNKAMFDEAGIPCPSNTVPMTWDEFKAIGKKLTKKVGKEVVQYAAHFHKMELFEALVVQKGGKLLDNDTHPTKVVINTPEGIAGLQLMVDLIKDEILPPHFGEWEGPWGTPDSAVATGKVAIMQAGLWSRRPLKAAGIDFGTAPLPRDKNRATRGNINSLAIYRSSKKVDAAWTFIKWMASVEGQIEFVKTGDLPANKNAIEPAKQNHELPLETVTPFFDELQYVIPGSMLSGAEFNALIDDVVTQMLQLKITPQETAAILEKEGNEIIKYLFE